MCAPTLAHSLTHTERRVLRFRFCVRHHRCWRMQTRYVTSGYFASLCYAVLSICIGANDCVAVISYVLTHAHTHPRMHFTSAGGLVHHSRIAQHQCVCAVPVCAVTGRQDFGGGGYDSQCAVGSSLRVYVMRCAWVLSVDAACVVVVVVAAGGVFGGDVGSGSPALSNRILPWHTRLTLNTHPHT